MKIGIFTYDFYPFEGGQGRYLHEAYQRVYKSNKFLIFSPCVNNFKNHISLFKKTKIVGKNILFSFLLQFKINEIVKKYALRAVHFQCGPGGIILIKKPKAKMICTVHHTYYQQYTLPGQEWKKILYLLEKTMYQKADKIICDCEDTANALEKYYNLSRRKITVIPIGIDLTRFKPLKNIKKIPNSLIFVGRLDKRKGIDFLIETLPLVKRKILGIKLFVIGSGKLKPKLEKYINNHHLEKNVQFLGFVPDKELLKWYNQTEIAVIPSAFEGFGITVIEAMACGMPVLATKVGGIKNIIKNGQNGILVEYGNKKQMAKQIIRLLNNQLLRKKLMKAGLKTVKENYNWQIISQKTRSIYY